MNQQQASVKQEIALKGSALGRILFGAMYLLAFLTVLFGIIGIVSI